MNDVKAKLLELIAAVQAVDFDHPPPGENQERLNLTVQNGGRSLEFGYGYFSGKDVVLWEGDSNTRMTPEAGVNKLFWLE